MRVLISHDPFADLNKFWGERGRWPAQWINHPQADGTQPVVMAFRRQFALASDAQVRVHVSADQRYELFLDGQRIGRGPERGDRLNWFFETYDLNLSAGAHVLVARVWWLGDQAPWAQVTLQPGFLVAAEGRAGALLSTGAAPWDCTILGGYDWVGPAMAWGTGLKVHVKGQQFAWNYECGQGDGWVEAAPIAWAAGAHNLIDQTPLWFLKPAMLPPMLERMIHVGVARHVEAIDRVPQKPLIADPANHLPREAEQWNGLLRNRVPLTILPHTLRRVIVDLEDYYTGYPELTVSGGDASLVRIWWAEALFVPGTQGQAGGYAPAIKGHRDRVHGQEFIGIGDTFEPDGGQHRRFDTLWWEAGRYLEVVIRTADQPLIIEQLALRETHYPHQWTGDFAADDSRLAEVTPIAQRAMEMCSHETYMDCPYYEQMMYTGDTRLEVLVTYTWTGDDRLPRKALQLYDESRKSPGFTQSRYPCRIQQTIPPFSAWWVGMVHDFMMWRDDPQFVRDLLPGVRQVLDTFAKFATADGLIAGPPGWNFMDWVPSWTNGMPPEGDTGQVSGVINLQLAWIHRQAAELEDYVGEPELASLQRRRADQIAAACEVFWDEARGLFADDRGHRCFSEHAQCLALLGASVAGQRRQRVIENLLAADDLARTTIYFTHYLFETYRLIGRMDCFLQRMDLWFGHKALGMKTTLEMPEPSRSDCHAWGAHPLFHYLASVLGIRPASPGFATVQIAPNLDRLQRAWGQLPHPQGMIRVDLQQRGGTLGGHIELPLGVAGTLLVGGRRLPLSGQVDF